VFFTGMALLILATVFVGFAHTYYLAGVFRAPLPAPIIHVHGAAFTCWILLLVAQTSLVSTGRVDVHRRLGVAGFLLACVMVVLGVWAGTNSLGRAFGGGGDDPLFFYIIPVTDMLIFATLIAFAFRERRDSAAHKRLIMIGTTALMIAAVARWPFAPVHFNPPVATLFTYVFLVMLVAYDLWSMRRVHRATIWGSVFLIVVQWIRVPIGQSAAWHGFAAWVQAMAR
jgi:FtsH-binding integral membrane protein